MNSNSMVRSTDCSALIRLLALLCAVSLPTALLPAQMIQLGDGTVLVGEVVDATSEGLSFRRIDNGGLLELGWDDLSSLSAERVKRLKGLVVANEEEVKIEADVIVYLLPGGGRQEVVGSIVDYSSTHVMLKRKAGVLPIPRQAIKDLGKREVPALDIFTPEELYQRELAEADPGDDPDKHVLLSEQLRRGGLYEQAIVHLERAQELGGGRQGPQLPGMLARLQLLVESGRERDLLSRIKVMRNRGAYDRCAELIVEFEQSYPDSALFPEFEREKQRVADARETTLIDRLRQAWDRTVRTAANVKAGERNLSFANARNWAEEQMADEVFERMARVANIEVEEVKALWESRREYGNVRAIMFTYGVGSWVLGADKVIAGTKRAEPNGGGTQQASSEEEREMERIIRKLREARERSQQAKSKRGGSGSVSEEDWWEDATRNERTAWLRAYFAEFGGHMEVTAAYASPCATCQGRGYLVEQAATGRERRQGCPVCHGTKFTRAIRAR